MGTDARRTRSRSSAIVAAPASDSGPTAGLHVSFESRSAERSVSGRCRQVAKAVDCKSTTVGSTPTSASFTSRSLAQCFAATCVAAVIWAAAGAASAQTPFAPFIGPTGPSISSAPREGYGLPTQQNDGVYGGQYGDGTLGSDVAPGNRRYTEDEMNEYFDGRVADEYFDGDCYVGVNDRVCYGYFAIDALYWDRIRSASSTIAVRSSTGAVAMSGRNFIWNDLEEAARITGGYVFDSGLGIEAVGIYDDDLDTNSSVTNLGDTSFNAFGTPTAAFAPNFFQADTVGASSSVALHSYEVNVMETDAFFNLLAGFRYVELQDRTWIRAFKGGTVSGANFETSNRLMGGQIGMKTAQRNGVFGFEFMGKMGFYINDGSSETTIFNAGAGLPDQTRRSSGFSEAFLAEAHLMVTYNPYIWLQFRAGIHGLTIMQTALATDQIRSTDFTGFALYERSDIVYYGPFAGAEVQW